MVRDNPGCTFTQVRLSIAEDLGLPLARLTAAFPLLEETYRLSCQDFLRDVRQQQAGWERSGSTPHPTWPAGWREPVRHSKHERPDNVFHAAPLTHPSPAPR